MRYSKSLASNQALRHVPRQMRGQRKVEHILRSAESLFAEVGFDQATTNAIAARAGVSIGSLYQFFSGKDAILEAIAGRYLEQTSLAMTSALDKAGDVGLPELFTSLLERLVKLQEQRPFFLQCLMRSRPSPVLNQSLTAIGEDFTNQMVWLLEPMTAEIDPRILRLQARFCVETTGTLLALAVNAHGRERTLVIREIVTLLTRYLQPTLKVQGEA